MPVLIKQPSDDYEPVGDVAGRHIRLIKVDDSTMTARIYDKNLPTFTWFKGDEKLCREWAAVKLKAGALA